jgi:alkanesulfonate monooxygenase SsuD/methylene tetrahydromethanopterin reductase-like flavin-dependent oxidoreductase (luciferase family)
MKFGVAFANIGAFVDPAQALRLARAAEGAGFESIWTVDHVVVPGGYRSSTPTTRRGGCPRGKEQSSPIP